MKLNLGAQSFCFHKTKEHAELVNQAKEIGLNAIELCHLHTDIDNPGFPSKFADIVDVYQKGGVEIISLGVRTIKADSSDRCLFECAKIAGCKHISVNFSLKNLDAELKSAESLAEEYDMKLGIHNHGGRHWLGTATALEWVFAKCSPRIGLCLDTAWAMDAMQNPMEMIDRFADRLYNVHFKDFTWNRDRSFNDEIVGSGTLDLKLLLETMKKIDFKGICILEHFSKDENPIPPLTACVKNIRAKEL